MPRRTQKQDKFGISTDEMKESSNLELDVSKMLNAPRIDKRVNINLYTPHANQKKVIASPARFKILRCGRRFGKTTFALNTLFLASILKENGTYWYVAPTYRQAKQIAWRMVLDLHRANNKKLFNKPPSIYDLNLQFNSGSYLELKGSDNEDSLRGVGLDGVILDEYALMKPNVWEEIIRPTLLDKGGWAIFISTPKGYNHFYDLEESAKGNKEWEIFHFTSYDNPINKKGEIDQIKEEITDEYFQQEYMASYVKFTGLIYKDWDDRIHLVEPFQVPITWPRWRSIDPGGTNPLACLWIAQDPLSKDFYLYDEHYIGNQTIRYHAEVINAKSIGQYFRQTFIDPSAKQWITDFAQFGIYATPGINTVGIKTKEQTTTGIGKVAELMKINPTTGQPRLHVFNTLENFVKEIKNYQWDIKKDKGVTERPKKTDDHLMDALRYFVNSYQQVLNIQREKRPAPKYQPNNSLTGY